MYVCGNDDLEERGSIGEGHFGVVAKMYHIKTKHTMAVKVRKKGSEIIGTPV